MRRRIFYIAKNLIVVIFTMFFLAGCREQIDPREKLPGRPGADPDSPLIGTRWTNTEWSGRNLYFETAETVLYTKINSGNSSYADYYYIKEERKGEVEGLGPFNVTENYQRMVFSNIEGYGHSMDFTRTD